MVRECAALNSAGVRCQAQPIRSDGFCYWHSPSLSEERDRKRREGGRAKSNKARAAKQLPSAAMTPAELQSFLIVVMKGAVAGRIDKGVANCVANLGRTIAALYPVADFGARLDAIECGGEDRPA